MMTEAQWALVQMLDGVQRHDLPNQLGLPDDEIDRIWSAYESAQVALAQPAPPADGDEGRQPSGYAYRYQSLGSSVIRFNGGGEVNGSRPVEAIPYWLGRPPQPVPPAEGEVGELVAWLRSRAADIEAEDYTTIYSPTPLTRAADLLEQRHPAPVPVSERLPDASDPGECRMPDGDCWWFDPHADGARYFDTYQGNYTHWLPAHALPLPAGEVK